MFIACLRTYRREFFCVELWAWTMVHAIDKLGINSFRISICL